MIPLEDFFRKPGKVLPVLSPLGGYLSWLEPWERRLNLVVQDLATGTTTRVTSVTDRDIANYVWASDQRLVYVRDRGGDENFRLFAVGRDGSNPIDLTPFDNVKCGLVDALEDEEDEILFQMNRRLPEVFDAYRLNVHTGVMRMVGENPGNVQQWLTDHDGRLRLATTTDGVNTSILYRERESDFFKLAATYDYKESARPLAFTFDDPLTIFVTSNLGRDRQALCEYDLTSGREKRVIFEHAEVDVSDIIISKKHRRLTGAVFDTDRRGYQFFDEQRASIQRLLDERLPGRQNRLVSHSRDESRFVVHSGSDRTRGTYFLLDVATSQLTKVFDVSPWLEESLLAEMRPIRYTSRDGLTIRGYLTLPRGVEPSRLPLVVNPHGGPWGRDYWGFNPEIQFLADRGFAVLQMNFRGSTGFGRKFLEASYGQWGLAMQDDVTDAARWAIGQGYADPARVAIYGGSYGGYAALSGLTRTPELYACGVSYVGVSNIFTWIAAFPPYWKPFLEMVYEMVGHPERDQERLRQTSPFFNAERIRVPLFVAQGANDPRVRKEESDQMVEALKKLGVDVVYMVKDDEGHGFQTEENRFDFYRAMERFLRQHLDAARAGPAPAQSDHQ